MNKIKKIFGYPKQKTETTLVRETSAHTDEPTTKDIREEDEREEEFLGPTEVVSVTSEDDKRSINWESEINSTNDTPELLTNATSAMVETKDLGSSRQQQNSFNALIPSETEKIPIVNVEKEDSKKTTVASLEETLNTPNNHSEGTVQGTYSTTPTSKEVLADGENNAVICKVEDTETSILSKAELEDFNNTSVQTEAEEATTNNFSTADKSEEILSDKENKDEQKPSVNSDELDNESVIHIFSAKAKLNEFFAPLGIKPEYITEEDAKLGFRTTIHIHFQGEKYHKRKQDAEHDVAYVALEKFEKIIQNVKIDIGETPAPAQGGKKFKSRIQECLQKHGERIPPYNTQLGNNGFSSSVTINKQTYKSLKSYPNKKDAEEDAAQVAFKALGFDNTVESPEKEIEAGKSPKNLLQEYLQKCSKGVPVYETSERNTPSGLFKSTVTCGENKYTGEGYNKKAAEADSAREALKDLIGFDFEEILNPE